MFRPALPSLSLVTAVAMVIVAVVALPAAAKTQPAASKQTTRDDAARRKVGWIEGELRAEMKRGGFAFGSAVHIRIFKQENALELWLRKDGRYQRFKTLRICKWSGKLGPKLREGDKQAPEGVYSVSRSDLRSRTKNHRAINLNFPNALDARLSRTGSALQIHGGCGSVGCYAMTDRGVEEIYRVVDAAFDAGQKRVAVHIFPFRMTRIALLARKDHSAQPFWSMLQPIYAAFRKTRTVDGIRICGTRYLAPGDVAKPPEACVPVWQGSRGVRVVKRGSKSKVAPRPKPLPRITVRCNLRLPSCKRWLAFRRRKLAAKGIKTRGIQLQGAQAARGARGQTVTTRSASRDNARTRRRRALRN